MGLCGAYGASGFSPQTPRAGHRSPLARSLPLRAGWGRGRGLGLPSGLLNVLGDRSDVRRPALQQGPLQGERNAVVTVAGGDGGLGRVIEQHPDFHVALFSKKEARVCRAV